MNVFGQRGSMLIGLAGFGLSSALGGAAVDFPMVVTARALQGVFAALLMPTTLAILTTTFSDARERGKAFGIFASIAGAGASLGLILGGVLTDYVSWRWTLYVNLAFAVVGVLGTIVFVHAQRTQGLLSKLRTDWAGIAFSAIGAFLLVFGFSDAEQYGWGSAATVSTLAAGAVALIVFFAVEAKVGNPILPLRVILDRTRGASLIVLFVAGAALYATFLFLTYYFQRTLGYSPLVSGFAFLPQTLSSMTIATLGGIFLLRRVSGRVLMPVALLVAALGLFVLGFISAAGNYRPVVLPGLILLGAGLALAFTVAFGLGLAGVDAHDAGVASGAVNAVQQIGGSVGTALLSTIAAAVATSSLAAELAKGTSRSVASIASTAAVDSYTVAFWISAGALVVAAVIAAALIKSTPPTEDALEELDEPLELSTAVS